jgi:hypothetical protein
MRIPAKFTDEDLRDAHAAAGVVASEKYRPYLPGRLLFAMASRFRDDVAEALKMEPAPMLSQCGQPRHAELSELTSTEFDELVVAVTTLVTRFAVCMDDPALPNLLRDFRDALLVEHAERAHIAEELTARAKAS